MEAKRLARSDLLRDIGGEPVELRAVYRVPGRVRVYNLRVAKHHTYYAAGVWVHNADSCPDPPLEFLHREELLRSGEGYDYPGLCMTCLGGVQHVRGRGWRKRESLGCFRPYV